MPLPARRNRPIMAIWSPRTFFGFSATKMRPWLTILPKPMAELTYSTAGSERTILIILSCNSDMASMEMSGAASVEPTMKPVSSIGKKPFGMFMYIQALMPKVAKVTSSIANLALSTQSSEIR